MFWRFHLPNGSSIDSLLNKDDVSLEAILDEDDLLQECKGQNTRLIDYFQRIDVLHRLMGYVTGQIDGEGNGSFKYPHVATEVLCSEIWSIVEACVKHSNQLLVPFWETVLERPAEEMKTQMVLASHFTKINSVFLGKKPAEMLAFIQSQPSIIDKLLYHIETPAFADLLMRIVQLDEQPAGIGVLQWLSQEGLMPKLIERLSPNYPSDMHAVVSEVIKGIIAIAAPSPGSGVSEGASHAPPSNLFARELALRESLSHLTRYMLTQYGPDPPISGGTGTLEPENLPNHESSTSSVIHSIGIIIELIRQNNADYFEPYLFHTLRNRLIQYQQQIHTYSNREGRQLLEKAMQEMVDRMGVVHLGPLLDLMCDRMEDFQRYLVQPRSLTGTIPTTIGDVNPLTFERYRICELYAELLHGSNMSILNRSSEFDHLYDNMGRLQGGLSALEELAKVISIGNGANRDVDAMDDQDDSVEPAKELPVSSGHPALSHDSDEDMIVEEPGSSDDEEMEEISMSPQPINSPLPPEPSPVQNTACAPPQSTPSAPSSPTYTNNQKRKSTDSFGSGSIYRISKSSRQNSRKTLSSSTRMNLPLGEKFKKRFLELNVLSTLLDLFFEFPWNNFLHSVVYDIIHQILTGRDEHGYNRELIVSLFRDAKVMHRIVEGQKQNDVESSKPKGLRLGYMGHLTLISEDVLTTLEHSSPDLRLTIMKFTPEPEWNDYVNGRYQETKNKDTSLLGGGKPALSLTRPGSAASWKVDEQDIATTTAGSPFSPGGTGLNAVGTVKEIASRVAESQKEFRKSVAERREVGTHYDPGAVDEGEPSSSGDQAGSSRSFKFPEDFGSSSDDEDSDDEDTSGWLASSTFRPSAATRESQDMVSESTLPDAFSPRRRGMDRRPLSEGFEDAFDPTRSYGSGDDDHFEADDGDGFGPFSDSAATSDADPFTLSTSFSRELDDSTFDTFGDFGEFQAASGDAEQGHVSRGGSDLGDSGAFGDLVDSTGSGGFTEMGGVGSGEMISSWIVQDSWTLATASGSFVEEDVEVPNRERQRRETEDGGSSK